MPSLQTLNIKHFQIAHLLAQGKSRSEVARRLNITPAGMQNCLDTPEFMVLLEDLKQEYATQLSEKLVLPFVEMQQKFNEEALGALSRVVDISQSDRANQTVLNANLALLDRASNTPKASKIDPGEAQRDLFNVSVVQLVLETAMQVGDTTIMASAQRALDHANSLPTLDADFTPIQPPSTPSSPFALRPIDEITPSEEDEDEDL